MRMLLAVPMILLLYYNGVCEDFLVGIDFWLGFLLSLSYTTAELPQHMEFFQELTQPKSD